MRLTLRTLLAYLDNVLEPADAAELGKKIEESEVAKALIRRIRELLRKDKLGAPEVLDHRESLDPNTVAEYLDNTLPAEKVADFEKVCLESDIELAEVAACHQILALVLGEPAEVAPALREKIYKLPQVAAQQESAVERIARDLTADVEGFPPAETQPTGASPIRPRAEAQFVSNVSERARLSAVVVGAFRAVDFGICCGGWTACLSNVVAISQSVGNRPGDERSRGWPGRKSTDFPNQTRGFEGDWLYGICKSAVAGRGCIFSACRRNSYGGYHGSASRYRGLQPGSPRYAL